MDELKQFSAILRALNAEAGVPVEDGDTPEVWVRKSWATCDARDAQTEASQGRTFFCRRVLWDGRSLYYRSGSGTICLELGPNGLWINNQRPRVWAEMEQQTPSVPPEGVVALEGWNHREAAISRVIGVCLGA